MSVRRTSAAVVLSLIVLALVAGLPATVAAAVEPELTLSTAPATLTCGASADLTVQGASPGAALTLYRKRASETEYVKLFDAVAGAGGAVTWSVKPPQTTTYRVDQAAGEAWPAASAEATVSVRHRVGLSVVAASPLIEDKRVRYTVSVRPAHPGGTAQLQRWTGEEWVPLSDITLGAESTGTVRLPAGRPGRLVVRARMAADAEHLNGTSRAWRRMVYDRRNPYGVPTRYPHLILVDLSKYKLYYHEHGNVIRVFDCVLGRPGLPTPKGRFKIYAKDPNMYGPYGPYRMRYLGLYAVHGTNEPWLLSRFPRNYSHGCTRLSNENITWLYRRVHVGTPVWNVP